MHVFGLWVEAGGRSQVQNPTHNPSGTTLDEYDFIKVQAVRLKAAAAPSAFCCSVGFLSHACLKLPAASQQSSAERRQPSYRLCVSMCIYVTSMCVCCMFLHVQLRIWGSTLRHRPPSVNCVAETQVFLVLSSCGCQATATRPFRSSWQLYERFRWRSGRAFFPITPHTPPPPPPSLFPTIITSFYFFCLCADCLFLQRGADLYTL